MTMEQNAITKVPPDSISRAPIFANFPGGHAPQPLRKSMYFCSVIANHIYYEQVSNNMSPQLSQLPITAYPNHSRFGMLRANEPNIFVSKLKAIDSVDQKLQRQM